MIEYNAYIEVEAPEGADVYTARAVDDAFEKVTEIEGPAAGLNTRVSTISVRYNVMAEGPREAIEVGLTHLCHVLGYKDGIGGDKLVAMEAEPFVPSEEKDLVSKSEIARRLEISTTRVGQLAAMEDFPKGTSGVDSSRVLYRWGDVVAWRREREETATPGRPAKGEDDERSVAA